MTLCIAAHAYWKGKHCLVTATDFAVETESSSADFEDKLGFDGERLFMFAGQWNRSLEFASICRKVWSEAQQSDPNQIGIDVLRRAVTVHKRKIAAEYVGSALGMNYAEFLRSGKNLLPDSTFARMVNDIGNTTLDCSFIIATFYADAPCIYRVHETGMVEPTTHFCAIGNGRTIAESILFLRSHSGEEPLPQAIYQVYEAMRLGSNAPGVSKHFAMSVFTPKKDGILWERVSPANLLYLEECMLKFGLRSVGEVKELDLEPFCGEWHALRSRPKKQKKDGGKK